MIPSRILRTLVLLLTASALHAGEGMWLLDAVHRLPLDTLKRHGLRLSATEIYNPDGRSLKDVMVMLPGGTGAFISESGLILTNHHIAYGAIVALSSTEHDYLKDGFVARERKEELRTSYTAEVIVAMNDVTAEVKAAVQPDLGPEERPAAVQAALRALEKNAVREGEPYTYRASEMYSGLRYMLFTILTLRDVRLVYAPPSAIGNFGGEVDNWIWPRHTGDFSLMRAYMAPDGSPAAPADSNVPFSPRAFLPISTKGVQEGDVAMVMGFPGRTFRYHDAASVALAHDATLPWQIDLSATRIGILEEAGGKDRAVELQYASRLRGMANSYKNYLGVLEGMEKADFLSVKRAREAELAAFIASTAGLRQEFGDVMPSIESAVGAMGSVARKSALFNALNGSVDLLGIARRVNGFVERFAPDDQGNVVSPTDGDRTAFRDSLMRTYRAMNPDVDRAMLQALMLKSTELPQDQRIAVFDRITRGATGGDAQRRVREYLDELYAESRITTPERLMDLLGEDGEDILDDPFVRLRRELAEEQVPVTARTQKAQTTIGYQRGRYIDALMRMKKTDLVYPDANRTLRFGYGLVTTLEPRDAVKLGYRTTLRGVMEKEQEETPFLVPPRLRELWERKDFGPYAENGDVTVAFLATLDNTGGSSGSPVINGRGELIGCAFDGNWEGVLGDYYYQDRLNRAICVDARYMLFVLDKFAGAKNILQELVIK